MEWVDAKTGWRLAGEPVPSAAGTTSDGGCSTRDCSADCAGTVCNSSTDGLCSV